MTPSDIPPPPAPAKPQHPGEAPIAYRGRPPVQSSSPINIVLIAASIVVTIYVGMGEHTREFKTLTISAWPSGFYGLLPEVRHGQWWRLWTPMFIHLSVMHLGFNMMGMYNLGGPLERVKGTSGYLILCLVLAVLSNLGQYFFAGPYFGGMSGVLYGLFGYIWLRARFDRRFPLEIPRETLVIAMVWFVLCFTGLLGPIGNASHSVGLVIGALWGAFDGRWAMNHDQQPVGVTIENLV